MQVYFDTSGSGFKITRENPYFTQSESYTLDVSIPMNILANRHFFGCLHRKDCSKVKMSIKCMLRVNNTEVLSGSVKITQVTEKEVKIQLLGGKSEVNFMSQDNQEYLDKIDLGDVIREIDGYSESGRAKYKYSTSNGMKIRVTPVYDETYDVVKQSPQVGLIDLFHKVIEHYGFTVVGDEIDTIPWNSIYVATAMMTTDIKATMPHWTVKAFIDEVCTFFNVTLYIDQVKKTVEIRSNRSFKQEKSISISPIEEYTAEISEESKSCISNDDIEFSLSSSDSHDYDCIDNEIRKNISRKEFNSRSEAITAWGNLASNIRSRYVFTCPDGDYASWMQEPYRGEGQSQEVFTKIDMFAPLKRENSDNSKTLKIVPVAMAYIYDQMENNGAEYKMWYNMPSMENPAGSASTYFTTGRSGGRRRVQGDALPDNTVQECIEGEGSIEKKEKEDRLQVMFIDDTTQTYWEEYSSVRNKWSEYEGSVGFTDFELKPHYKGQAHERWSLALSKSNATYYLGQLHENGFAFNTNSKQTFKFISDTMPDPTIIFLIEGKKYGCEKIEANVNNDGFDKLMTGYFYEML